MAENQVNIAKRSELACVTSVSVEKRAKNWVFGVLPARKMGRDQIASFIAL